MSIADSSTYSLVRLGSESKTPSDKVGSSLREISLHTVSAQPNNKTQHLLTLFCFLTLSKCTCAQKSLLQPFHVGHGVEEPRGQVGNIITSKGSENRTRQRVWEGGKKKQACLLSSASNCSFGNMQPMPHPATSQYNLQICQHAQRVKYTAG